ncbi:MAG: hypothetical protein J4473_03310 [Candidatus Aenigmarchaeota archaeon]|nr:hypothetical protein [Candidatus Aenigmarchaeota archaeon]
MKYSQSFIFFSVEDKDLEKLIRDIKTESRVPWKKIVAGILIVLIVVMSFLYIPKSIYREPSIEVRGFFYLTMENMTYQNQELKINFSDDEYSRSAVLMSSTYNDELVNCQYQDLILLCKTDKRILQLYFRMENLTDSAEIRIIY